jgi:hypothetical protein
MTTLTAFDRPFLTVARTLLRIGGRDVTVVQRIPGESNPDTGQVSEPTPIPYTVRGMAMEFGDAARTFGEAFMAGMEVRQSDRVLLVAGDLPFRPEPGRDRILLEGSEWTIHGVNGISSGARNAAYVMALRS